MERRSQTEDTRRRDAPGWRRPLEGIIDVETRTVYFAPDFGRGVRRLRRPPTLWRHLQSAAPETRKLCELPGVECLLCGSIKPDAERIESLPSIRVPSSVKIRCAQIRRLA